MRNGVSGHAGTSLADCSPRSDALAARLGRAAGGSLSLPAGVEVVQDWPDRVAAVITATPQRRAPWPPSSGSASPRG